MCSLSTSSWGLMIFMPSVTTDQSGWMSRLTGVASYRHTYFLFKNCKTKPRQKKSIQIPALNDMIFWNFWRWLKYKHNWYIYMYNKSQWTIWRHLNVTMTFPGKMCLRRDRHPKSVTFWKRPEPLHFIFKTCIRLNKNPTWTRFCNVLFSVQDVFVTPYLPWNIANL